MPCLSKTRSLSCGSVSTLTQTMERLSGQNRHIPLEKTSHHVCNFSLSKWHPHFSLCGVNTRTPPRYRGNFTHKFGKWLASHPDGDKLWGHCVPEERCATSMTFYPKITWWIWSRVDQITPTGKSLCLRPGQCSASLLRLWIRRDMEPAEGDKCRVFWVGLGTEKGTR